MDAQTLEAEGDATEEDKIGFRSLRDAPSGSSTDVVPLKVENLSPEGEAEHRRKQNAEKTAAFISSAAPTLKRLIDRAVDLRLLESKAGAFEFTMAIGEKAVCVRKKTANGGHDDGTAGHKTDFLQRGVHLRLDDQCGAQ